MHGSDDHSTVDGCQRMIAQRSLFLFLELTSYLNQVRERWLALLEKTKMVMTAY
jgi:hypothetical protein